MRVKQFRYIVFFHIASGIEDDEDRNLKIASIIEFCYITTEDLNHAEKQFEVVFPFQGGGEQMSKNQNSILTMWEKVPLFYAVMGWLACSVGLTACTNLDRVIPAPMVFDEQSKEILAIAPLGTQKEQAISLLNAAGISGEFASSPSIYYCDLWERENGKRWHLNVALLFNEAGALYKTRPAQAAVSWKSDSDSASDSETE